MTKEEKLELINSLTLLKNNIGLLIKGLCLLTDDLALTYKSNLTWCEANILYNYINNNPPLRFKILGSEFAKTIYHILFPNRRLPYCMLYFYPLGSKKPRLRWINKHIKKLSA